MAQPGPKARPSIERFFETVTKQANGCWLWGGQINRDGYGVFRIGSLKDGSRRKVLAHRFAYEVLTGPIHKGLQTDHLCRTPACVNSAHLELVTPRENVRRSRAGEHNRQKTVCPFGHIYSPANTYYSPSGGRYCRACAHRRREERKASGYYSRPEYKAQQAVRMRLARALKHTGVERPSQPVEVKGE